MEYKTMMKPEVKYIAISGNDDSISIMQFVTRSIDFEREAINEAIEKEVLKAGIVCKSWRMIEAHQIPTDRYFRNAWTDNGNAIEVDLNKAKDIQKDKLRKLRTPLLEQLDLEYLKADEQSDRTAKKLSLQKSNYEEMLQIWLTT
jgi:hypothetical protein